MYEKSTHKEIGVFLLSLIKRGEVRVERSVS